MADREAALLPVAREILDGVARKLKKAPEARIAIVSYVDEAPVGNVRLAKRELLRHGLAAQRSVNAKAYLVRQHEIDPIRIEARVGSGPWGVADVIALPRRALADSPWLQDTKLVDEELFTPFSGEDLFTTVEQQEEGLDAAQQA